MLTTIFEKINILIKLINKKELKLRKIKVSERDNFLCNFERLATEFPGAGKYNPHVNK